jgi:uncharacterized membrane protein
MTPSQSSPNAPPPAPPGDDPMRRVELVISNLLRVGVAVSLALIVVGSIVTFVRHPAYVTSPDELAGLVEPGGDALPHTLGGVATGLRDLRGQAIVALGLLVLIATPMMRVAVSVVAFVVTGDRLYTLITLAVFCLLMLSLVLGAVE